MAVLIIFCVGVQGTCFPHRPSYAEGVTMIKEAAEALAESLNPRPRLPGPKDGGDTGSCDQMLGDPDRETRITYHYNLGVVPLPMSDAWFDQGRRYLETHGFVDITSRGVAGDDQTHRDIGGKQKSSGIYVALDRYHSGGVQVLPTNGTTEITVVSPCVFGPS
jgi:hypothetical protein